MRRGGQLPTFENVGSYAYSDGAQAIEMFEAYGRKYYDSQKYEMTLFYARNEDGSYASNSIGISKPRQNGKSFGARDYSLDSACMEGKKVLYSAHRAKTVRDMFKEMLNFIEAHEDFMNELQYVYKDKGNEGIYFKNGGCIEFQTRTNSGGRGGTYDIVIIDEAQELTTAHQEAILPSISASQEIESGDGTQVIYLGTPPGLSCIGTVFRMLHDRAHSGNGGIWWLEWGVQAERLSDINLDDVDLWYACNPAMGRRMSEKTVKNERDTMSPDGFARERLGWWSSQIADAVIKQQSWEQCSTDNPPTDGAITYSVKFSPDGATGTLAVCQHSEKPHVEVIQVRSMAGGLSWFADWLEERADGSSAICIDGMSNAQPLIDELIRRGVNKRKLIKPKSNDMTTACSLLLNSVNENKLTHYNQEQLNEAVKTVTKRNIGSNGGFGFSGDGAELIEACALALWCVGNKQSNPNKKMRVSF